MYEITGKTGLLCLLGSPVAHSVSPAMHNEACRLLGLDYRYLAFDIAEEKMADAVNGLKTIGARGWNITMPGKKIMCSLVDRLSPQAEISESCNTVVNENGVLYGYTTDGIGFIKAIEEYDVSVKGQKMTIMGTGGASMSMLVQSAFEGAEQIAVFNRKGRSFERACEIAQKLNVRTDCRVSVNDIDKGELLKDSIAQSSILVNGTSVGMAPDTEASIIKDTAVFHKELFVFDAIYNPRKTRFLQEAERAGCRTGNGMYMLLYQGAASFELWTGRKMPIEEIKEKYFK